MKQLRPEDFEVVGAHIEKSETIVRPPLTYWQDAWRRFKANKVAMAATILLIIIAVMTVVGPTISGYSLEKVNVSERNQRPSKSHWFGTDRLGRDLFTRVWSGGRVSILIGVIGALVVSAIGCLYGAIAAYFGGAVDMVMMRIVEILSSVPHLLVVIMLSIILDSQSIPTLVFAMTITGWCPIARLVRAQMLQISSSEYVLAAKIMGVSPVRIALTHIIPNTMSVIIVNLTFRIPGFIFGEAFLSYVGLGVKPPDTSWGALASEAQQTLMFYPYQMFFPAILIALTMLCFSLMGDGLRDALDPRLRR